MLNGQKLGIVLTSPPFGLEENFGLLDFVGQYGTPINLVYLAASLAKANINTRLLDLSYGTESIEMLAKNIVEMNPEFVGVAVHFTFLVNKSLKLISLIKKLEPKIKIIVGGVHFTAVPQETMNECPEIDIGILGEAEEAIVEVMRALKEGRGPAGINGVIFRKEKNLITLGSSNTITDVNKLSFPIFDHITLSPYSPALYKEKRDINLPIITARGCPFACTFCDRTVLGRNVRFYSIDYLSEMIDMLFKKFKVNCLDLADENFCITKNRFNEICELLRDKFLKYNITWSCSMRADSVDSYTGKALYDAGCRSVIFGIESGSSKMLNVYNKKLHLDELPEKCRMIMDGGISLAGSFIIGGPGEDKESISDTIDLIKKIDLDYMFLWYFVPFPGSPIYHGIENKGTLLGDYSNRTGHHISFIPSTLSREELEDGYRSIYRTFYSKPSVIMSMVRRHGLKGISQICSKGVKYLNRFIFN